MCYIVAKHTDFDGCVAFKTTHGKNLVNLKRRIEAKVGYTKIELITISRPSAYPAQIVATMVSQVSFTVRL